MAVFPFASNWVCVHSVNQVIYHRCVAFLWLIGIVVYNQVHVNTFSIRSQCWLVVFVRVCLVQFRLVYFIFQL
jgi:hypothetical protein